MVSMQDDTTVQRRLIPARPTEAGWRQLEVGPGEPLDPSNEQGIDVVRLIHLSDSHLCDAQSPARLEFLDREGDPHVTDDETVFVGTYRAHEMLSTHTLDALIRAAGSLAQRRKVDAVIVTGDGTDNAQANELEWYFTILNGGVVVPDSGLPAQWEGVGGGEDPYDRSYWHPGGAPPGHEPDFPHLLYGFPTIPGLLDKAREAFRAPGLPIPWWSVYGNHDALLQGTVAPSDALRRRATGIRRPRAMPRGWDYARVMAEFSPHGPANYPPESLDADVVSADERRAILSREQWVDRHHDDQWDHGPHRDSRGIARTWWSTDINGVLVVALDTVNPHGGWEGSVDDEQLAWLDETLGTSTSPLAVLTSHHPPHALTNLYAPPGTAERRGEADVLAVISRHPQVGLWLAGHRHRHRVERRTAVERTFDFWVVETSSTIDWPQQGRLLTLRRSGDQWTFASEVCDHRGEVSPDSSLTAHTPDDLAGWSRLLALNAWQRRRGPQHSDLLAGGSRDRNVVLAWNEKHYA